MGGNVTLETKFLGEIGKDTTSSYFPIVKEILSV